MPGGGGRNDLAIRASYDEGKTWPVARRLHKGGSAYSDLAVLPDGSICCLYEADGYKTITFREVAAWMAHGRREAVGVHRTDMPVDRQDERSL